MSVSLFTEFSCLISVFLLHSFLLFLFRVRISFSLQHLSPRLVGLRAMCVWVCIVVCFHAPVPSLSRSSCRQNCPKLVPKIELQYINSSSFSRFSHLFPPVSFCYTSTSALVCPPFGASHLFICSLAFSSSFSCFLPPSQVTAFISYVLFKAVN